MIGSSQLFSNIKLYYFYYVSIEDTVGDDYWGGKPGDIKCVNGPCGGGGWEWGR